ncbi:MAG TPA: tyrosine--tRNA ligase [Candidatus Omnitrophica bacterium]|nr:tyrosine--tRNA ligase [Candidatus Omnitrophota bacterium]
MRPSEQLSIIKRGVEEIIGEDDLLKKLTISCKSKKPLRIKAGFDPSAPDLHLGHMVLLKKLKDFQDLGHEVYFLIGDFTARIGDPSGQKETRPKLSKKEAQVNAKTYKRQIFKVLNPKKTRVVFNSKWLQKMNFEGVLELSSRYTIARILERDDFMLRYKEGKPISLTEFLYPLIQGYDSVALNADVELGGRDQKFNLLVGRDLQRDYGQSPQVIIMLPILEGTDGEQKMSKSLNNYIAIEDSSKDIFGKVMSIPDGLIEKYARLLSNLEIAELRNMPFRDAKIILAQEITRLICGDNSALKAKENFIKVFSKKEAPQDLEEFIVSKDMLNEKKEIWIVDLIVKSGCAPSNNEARRLIKQGAVYIDNNRIDDDGLQLGSRDILFRVGRHRFKKIVFKG